MISNLCDPDPPTSQTDGQTEDMQSQDRALHYSASHGKNKEITLSLRWPRDVPNISSSSSSFITQEAAQKYM